MTPEEYRAMGKPVKPKGKAKPKRGTPEWDREEARRAAIREAELEDQKYKASVMRSFGLPDPVFEFKFHPTRKFRTDIYFEANGIKLAVEVEGGIWTGGRHINPVTFLQDMEKYNYYPLFGIFLLRCTPDQLLTLDFLNLIKSTLRL